MPTIISRAVIERIAAAAREAGPHECCGLLLASTDGCIVDALPARNVVTDPERSFEIDPALLIAAHRRARTGGAPIAGCYHSHPAGDVRPSPADAAAAEGNGWLWIIASGDGGSFGYWRAVANGGIQGRFDPAAVNIAD